MEAYIPVPKARATSEPGTIDNPYTCADHAADETKPNRFINFPYPLARLSHLDGLVDIYYYIDHLNM